MASNENTSAEVVLTKENYYENYGGFYTLNLTRERLQSLSLSD